MNALAIAHWGWGWGSGWGGGGFWPFVPILWGLFWVAVVGFAVWAWRRGGWGAARHTESATKSAEQILAERYARGEMNDEEYFQRSSVLKGGTS